MSDGDTAETATQTKSGETERADTQTEGETGWTPRRIGKHVGGREVTIPPGGQALECQFDLTTAIFVDQETSVDFQGCAGPTVGDAVGNGVDDTLPGDDDDDGGVLPASGL
jgi:hypothetical protein